MIMETHYYLINGTVKKGSKMPDEKDIDTLRDYKQHYNNWLSSLQPCDIDESELKKIKEHLMFYIGEPPIDITDIVSAQVICTATRCDGECIECNHMSIGITFKQPKQVESEYDTEHKLFLESGKEYLLENFDILSCDVETHQIALIAIRKALKQTKNIYSIDDQHGAFAQMYKKAQNMDIFDFITMFSEKYEIFKNR